MHRSWKIKKCPSGFELHHFDWKDLVNGKPHHYACFPKIENRLGWALYPPSLYVSILSILELRAKARAQLR